MATNKGWIKLHRNIMNNWVFDDPYTLKMFLLLCLTVNITEEKTTIDGNMVTVKPGQRITSTRRLAADAGYTWRTAKKTLDALDADNMIELQSIGHGLLVTVVNFRKYQTMLTSNSSSSFASSFASNSASSSSSRQLKKSKNRSQNGKEKTIKKSAQAPGGVWGGEPE